MTLPPDPALAAQPPQPENVSLALAAERVRMYAAQSKALNTKKAYASDWRDFESWCLQAHRDCLPATPETVALYIAALADVARVSTITRRLSSVAVVHQLAGHESPTRHASARVVMSGIRRVQGSAERGKRPVTAATLRAICATLPKTPIGLRDRALLLLGFAGAFRRSELVGLDVPDLEFVTEGAIVRLRRSKVDQDGAGREIGIPHGVHEATCPVRALRRWIEATGVTGPLFRSVNRHGRIGRTRLSEKAVALIVKRSMRAIGLADTDYAAHSLRSGLATEAALNGVPERVIMAQTGHRSVATVRRYIRTGNLFRENAAARVGL